MVHWSWLIVAFMAGAFFGMVLIAACVAAGRGDRLEEKSRRERELDETAP